MSYDLSNYRCVFCNEPITMKEFADGKAGRTETGQDRANHFTCRDKMNGVMK